MTRLAARGMARLVRALRRTARDERGNASIEFALLVPLFLTLFMSAFEVGVLMTRQVMLDRAMDVAIRNIRLGLWEAPTRELLKKNICDLAAVIPNCMASTTVELTPVAVNDWDTLDPNATCVDRDAEIDPVTEWEQGDENEMMLVRTCSIFDPVFGINALVLQLPLDESGEYYSLVSTSAFVNEPS